MKYTCVTARLPLVSCTEICQLYVVPEVKFETLGELLEFVGSVPQVIEVIELLKFPELLLLPGICQIVFPLLSVRLN